MLEQTGRFSILIKKAMNDNELYVGDRVQEKHLQREEDRCVLESGQKSQSELKAENEYFAIDGQVDFYSSKL